MKTMQISKTLGALAPITLTLLACAGGEASGKVATSAAVTPAATPVSKDVEVAATPAPSPSAPAAVASESLSDEPAARAAQASQEAVEPAHTQDDGHGHGEGDGHDHEDVGPIANPDIDVKDGPKIEYVVGQENHHFGKVMEGAVLNHTFDLKAAGTQDLIIKQVKPTCGCTIAKVLVQKDGGEYETYGFGDVISPGRSVQIGATLHTKNKHGNQKSRINIFSNDPRGTIQLGLEAEVDAFFTVNPRHIQFSQMKVGDVQEHVVKIHTSRGENVKLTMQEAQLPKGMTAELVPVAAGEEGKSARWDLKVAIGPVMNEGGIGHTFVLKSDTTVDGAEPLPNGEVPVYEVTISASARVTGMISTNPAYVAMGLVKPGQVVSRTVRIDCHDDAHKLGELQARVAGVQTDEWEYSEYFSVIPRPVDGQNAVEVEVRLNGLPETVNGSFRGRLIVDVGHPTKPSVEMPLTGVCRGAVTRTTPQRPTGQEEGAGQSGG